MAEIPVAVQVSEKELNIYFNSAIALAREAGEVVREAFHKEKKFETKECGTDLVTETDQKVEQLIIGSLKKQFPSHSFIGEESVAAGAKCNLTNNPTWIIDPIDGTTNFIHRFPAVAICIGLAVNKQVEIGVVYCCILDEMFVARRGKGAFCNNKPIHVSSITDLGMALVITELGYSRKEENLNVVMSNLRKLAQEPNAVHSIRLQGSAAVNMCTVAKGSAEAYYEFGIHVWDIAAASIIIEEAGGVVLDPTGGPLDLMSRRVVCAGTESLARQLCQLLEVIEPPRD